MGSTLTASACMNRMPFLLEMTSFQIWMSPVFLVLNGTQIKEGVETK